MTGPDGRRDYQRFNRWLLLGAGSGVLILLLILFCFDPARHALYPRCILYAQTGWQCPGCGGLRATHQLLHGNVVEAFRLNALFVCLLPLGAFFTLRWLVRRYRGITVPNPFRHPRWTWVLVAVITAFGVMRNLPWHRWGG